MPRRQGRTLMSVHEAFAWAHVARVREERERAEHSARMLENIAKGEARDLLQTVELITKEKERAASLGAASSGSTSDASEDNLTRRDVARLLGCAIASVRRLEDSGALPHRVDDAGVHRFRTRDVEALAPRAGTTSRVFSVSPAERAARAWELYADGASVLEVVTKLRIHPDEAHKLAASFVGPSHVVLPPSVVVELASLGFGDAKQRVTSGSILLAAKQLRAKLRELRAQRTTPAAA